MVKYEVPFSFRLGPLALVRAWLARRDTNNVSHWALDGLLDLESECISELLALMGHNDPLVRVAILRTFRTMMRKGYASEVAQAVPSAVKLLTDCDRRVRLEAIRCLCELVMPAVESEIVIHIVNHFAGNFESESNWYIRSALLASVSGLVGRLHSMPESVVHSQLDFKRLAESVFSALYDPDKTVRSYAAWALGSCAIFFLREASSGADRGASGNAYLQMETAVHELANLLADDVPSVRHSAACVLGRLGCHSNAAVPALLELLRKEIHCLRGESVFGGASLDEQLSQLCDRAWVSSTTAEQFPSDQRDQDEPQGWISRSLTRCDGPVAVAGALGNIDDRAWGNAVELINEERKSPLTSAAADLRRSKFTATWAIDHVRFTTAFADWSAGEYAWEGASQRLAAERPRMAAFAIAVASVIDSLHFRSVRQLRRLILNLGRLRSLVPGGCENPHLAVAAESMLTKSDQVIECASVFVRDNAWFEWYEPRDPLRDYHRSETPGDFWGGVDCELIAAAELCWKLA